MVCVLLQTILATFVISLVSLVGLAFSYKFIKKTIHYLISFAAASFLAIVFFDLLPHAIEELEGIHFEELSVFILTGIIIFFLVERFIHWHHCGKEECHRKKSFSHLVLIGDFVHNFLDGVVIAGAFAFNPATGWTTAAVIAAHEIPQEFGDFSVLIHSGLKKTKALLLNFYSALSAVVGGIVGFFLFEQFENVAPYIILIASGGFLYIALSDIIPAIHEHKSETKVLYVENMIFLATILVIYFLIRSFGH